MAPAVGWHPDCQESEIAQISLYGMDSISRYKPAILGRYRGIFLSITSSKKTQEHRSISLAGFNRIRFWRVITSLLQHTKVYLAQMYLSANVTSV